MAAELVLAPEAELDLVEAYGWYEVQRVGLGEELLSCVDACIQTAPMLAHKLTVNVPSDHRVEIQLPDDFPMGPAEVIVLATARTERGSRDQGWRKLAKPHPTLGKIVFHEDPSLPIDSEDWPA
jgi:hypothetical protein